jgi:peptide/nickel transport system substrate-binding protein
MKNKLLSIFITLSFLFALFSCHKKEQNNTLVVHALAQPDDLHPTNGASAERAEINLYIHLSLLRLNYETGDLMPCMVKELPKVSADGLKYSYEMRDDITWDDNTPITGYDVAFTTKANKCYLTNNPGLKPYWENIKEIIVDENNPKKFTVEMNRPYMLNTWFWVDFPIIQETYYDSLKTLSKHSTIQLIDTSYLNTAQDVINWAKHFNNSEFYSKPENISGAGPYKVLSWEKGSSIILEKKKDHWTNHYSEEWFFKANPQKIIFKINTNNASTKLELKNGLIDVSTYVDINTFVELSNDSSFIQNYDAVLTDTYNYIYMAFNMKSDGKTHQRLFDNKETRMAISQLIPYDDINKTVYENKNKRMISAISPLKKDFNEQLKAIEYNKENALKLLESSGWSDTDNNSILDKKIDGKKVEFEFQINYMSTQKQWEDLAKHISESLKNIGIRANLNPMDYNGYVTAAMTHDFDVMLGAWQSNAQPEDYSQLWHSNSWANNGLNFTGFGTKQTDAFIDSINKSTDETKRIALSKQFQEMIYQEQPYVFLFTQTRRVMVNKKWKNYKAYVEYPSLLLNTLTLE